MALTFAARQTVKMISGFAPGRNNIMIAHGINHIEKALLIAQRFGKLSASIAAYRTAVRLRPMSETGVRRAKAALSSGCKPHPAIAPPEAAGAAMEVTK